jgi:hypothetical protein
MIITDQKMPRSHKMNHNLSDTKMITVAYQSFERDIFTERTPNLLFARTFDLSTLALIYFT